MSEVVQPIPVSEIQDPAGNLYEIKDASARSALAGKLSSPLTAGTDGQVLTSDGQGGQSWQTPQSANLANKADKADTVLNTTLSRGRKENTTVGDGSFAFGYNIIASGNYSHAEGGNTTASGNYSHAENTYTTASGYGAHAEGTSTKASGSYAHSQGNSTIAQRKSQHAGGEYNVADTEGTTGTRGTFAEIIGNGSADNARSNARALDWSGNEYLGGDLYVGCDANSSNGTAVWATLANKADKTTVNTALDSKANKSDTVLTSTLSRGRQPNTTVGTGSFAFGDSVTSSANYTHAEGRYSIASGNISHAEGYYTKATGVSAHAEGSTTTASGENAHAEGYRATASGSRSHAEGWSTTASGDSSHAEGLLTTASGSYTHASGCNNVPNSDLSINDWVEDTSYEVGDKVVHQGHIFICTTANSDSAFNPENWTLRDIKKYAEIIGNGLVDTPSNARALDWEGNEYLNGNLYVGCDSNSENGFPVTKGIYLTDNDDTWGKVWAKLDTLSNNECAMLSVTAVSFGVISQGLRSSACGGFITRRDSSTFDILLRVTRLMIFNIYLVSASSSGFTYSEAIFNPTYYGLDQASSGYALDARAGRDLNAKIMPDTIIYQASAASHAFTVSNNSRNLFIMSGDGVTYAWIGYVYGSSTGVVTASEIFKGSRIGTVTFATNKITIPLTTASSVYCRSITVRGDPISN